MKTIIDNIRLSGRRSIGRLGRLSGLMALTLLASIAFSQSLRADLQLLDAVVAVVEDGVITESQIREQTKIAVGNLRANKVPIPADDVLREQIINHLVLESIQLQMGDRFGVRITDAELTDGMNSIAANNGMSLEQFKKNLEKQGLSYSETREQIRREMIINRVQQGNLGSRVQITEQEIDNFLNSADGQSMTAPTLHLLHALLPLPGDASAARQEEGRKLMSQLKADINAGKQSFEGIAKNGGYSGYKITSSDLGWRKSADIPSIFAEVTPTLAVNGISDPIKSASGWHIIKLAEKRGGKNQIVRQTHARHILVKPSAIRSEEETRKFIDNLHTRINAGEDFTKLAKQFSEDPGSALQGGDLGWANPGQFVPVFEDAMAKLDVNGVSAPFESQFGWHVLQVIDRRDQDISQLRFKNQAQRVIHQRKFEEELQTWLLKIRDEAFVEFK